MTDAPTWAEELARVLGAPVQTDPDVLASVSRDQAPLAPAGRAHALVRARSAADVQATLGFAHARGIPVVTRGGGSGLAGGANAVDGCVVLSTAAMDRIVSIDEAARLAVVEPGVINAELARAVAERGLYYAPDPSSRDISTIGGNIATNAGGACCLKYGVTGDHVAALAVALADGTVVRTGARTRKNVAGLDLTRLFVGSEGTLGVVVEATVRLLPAPRSPSTLLAFFASLDAAAGAIVALGAARGLSLLEVMDRVTVGAVEDMTRMDLDTSAEALVLAQSDGDDAAAVVARAADACRSAGASSVLCTDDAQEGSMLLAARRAALPALERLGATLLDDVAVPLPALPRTIAAIRAIGERHGVVIGTFGHAGDGNLHPTIVYDAKDAASEAQARAAFDEILGAAVALGGTITGEHGVGSLKRAAMSLVAGDAERALMARVKAAFDPRGILNPGKSF